MQWQKHWEVTWDEAYLGKDIWKRLWEVRLECMEDTMARRVYNWNMRNHKWKKCLKIVDGCGMLVRWIHQRFQWRMMIRDRGLEWDGRKCKDWPSKSSNTHGPSSRGQVNSTGSDPLIHLLPAILGPYRLLHHSLHGLITFSRSSSLYLPISKYSLLGCSNLSFLETLSCMYWDWVTVWYSTQLKRVQIATDLQVPTWQYEFTKLYSLSLVEKRQNCSPDLPGSSVPFGHLPPECSSSIYSWLKIWTSVFC